MYGMKGFFGIGKETTWGTPVAVTDYAELLSESLSEGIDRFEVKNIFGGLYEPADVAGIHRIAGDISLAGYPLILGHLLKAAMNVNSQSVVLSGSLWTHRFNTPQGDFSADAAGVPYTVEMNRDQTSSHQYGGMNLDRLVMALAPNQDLRLTASFVGKSAALLTATTPTFPGSPSDPFTFDTSSIQLGGSATSRIEALQISIDNQLEGIPALNGSTNIARIKRRGPQMVRLSGTIDFPDSTEYLDFKNQTQRAFKLALFKTTSFHFLIDIPQFVYTAFPLGTAGRDRGLIQFDGRAQFLVASNTAATFQLTTTKSNY